MATDDVTPKRRGKTPVITLEAQDVTPAATEADRGKDASADEALASAATTDEVKTAGAEVPSDAATPEQIAAEATPLPAEGLPPSGDAAAEPVTASESPPPVDSPPPVEPEPVVEAEKAPEPVSHEPAPPLAPAQESGGFGKALAAGVIGALLAGGATIGAIVAGWVPSSNSDALAPLEQRLTALDSRLRELAARPLPTPAAAPDLAPLTGRLEALDAARAALEQRIAALEQQPAPAVPAPQPSDGSAPAPTVDLRPVNAEIQALKRALEAVQAAQRTAAAAPPAQAPAPAVDMEAVRTAIDTRVRSAVTPQAERLAALDQRLQALARDIEAQAAQATSRAGEAQVAAERLAALEAARGQANAMGQRAALIASLGSLRAALDRGVPFTAELKTAQGLGLPADAAAPLAGVAERGLPAPPEIARRFSALAPSLVRAAPAAAASGGFVDRLTASAQSLIRIRPIGEAAGDDVPTTVSRIEAKLARADLSGALADFDRLPEPVKAVGASWAADARARLAADEALRRASADVLQSLGGR